MSLFSLVIFLISLISWNTQVHSAECWQISKEQVQVQWTAFKTPEKAGVKGSFTDFQLKGQTKGESIEAMAKDMAITINTQSVFTDNEARDQKIAANFFSGLKNKAQIQAQITKLEKAKLILAVNLNGIKRNVPMKYSIKDGTVTAEGVIDVLDFAMNSQLKAINKACYALHEGKTWSDVNIALVANFKRCQ